MCMIADMNDHIRRTVNVELAKKDMKRAELAEKLGMKRQYLTEVLNGKVATLPKSWIKILDELNLKLVAVPDEESNN